MDRKKAKTSVAETRWSVTEELQSEALDCLFGGNKRPGFMEERGFLGTVCKGTGANRRTLFLRRIVPQEVGWVGSTGHGLSFSPRYFSRALDEVSTGPRGEGIILVHSHPFPTRS